MSNPFHDPKTGEFTEGPGGGGTAGTDLKDHDASKHGNVSIHEKRAANQKAFEMARFENKINTGSDKPPVDYKPVYPGVPFNGLTASQHSAMVRASNKMSDNKK
jgi:hypothetical protein